MPRLQSLTLHSVQDTTVFKTLAKYAVVLMLEQPTVHPMVALAVLMLVDGPKDTVFLKNSNVEGATGCVIAPEAMLKHSRVVHPQNSVLL